VALSVVPESNPPHLSPSTNGVGGGLSDGDVAPARALVRASGATHTQPRRHLLTVALEDYYHVGTFSHLIDREQWYRFEARLEQGTRRTLALLDEFGIRATFFVLGSVADTMPELVRELADRGHEIASRGYSHRKIGQFTSREELRDELIRSREALERASGRRVVGHRIGDQWFGPRDLWALDVIAEAGYGYDSSIGPIFRRFANQPWRRFAHQHTATRGGRTLWEFPISTLSLLGFSVPIAGGNYFRQFPHALVRRAVDHWDRTCSAPFVMYFHTWELDPDQPRINAASPSARVRHYRNLDKLPGILRSYFEQYSFVGISNYLGLDTQLVAAPAARRPDPTPTRLTALAKPVPVSLIVPCYNEESSLPYLANTLRRLEEVTAGRYDMHYVFVDDRSTDATFEVLQRLFGARVDCTIVRHEQNSGVAAAIHTGLVNAPTEIACSIDCDCTYDPMELLQMVPLLSDGVDLVTASPYHPRGGVQNVPPWRVMLSKTLSMLYRGLLHQKLSTYTSCFRVYRRSRALSVDIAHGGFLGVAEFLGRLDLSGGRIVEYPAVLHVRVLGASKMKLVRTIAGHLRLLAELFWVRLRGGKSHVASAPVDVAEVVAQPPAAASAGSATASRIY
jgi:polysaccharide deacetylase family protein (PEP-CTERM system associated)